MESTLQEWHLQKEKKNDYQASLGSSEAKRRLLHKNKKKNQLMKKNIGMVITSEMNNSQFEVLM